VNPVRTTFHKAGILPVPATFAKALRGGCAYEVLWQFAQVSGFFCQIFGFFTYALKTWLFPLEKIFWRATPPGWPASWFGGILERNFRTHRVSTAISVRQAEG
jgi:hypothetical protein